MPLKLSAVTLKGKWEMSSSKASERYLAPVLNHGYESIDI